MSSEETKVAVMQNQIEYIKKQVDTIVVKLDDNYVTKEQHITLEKRLANVEDILRRLNWIIITGVVGALLTLVITVAK